MNNAYLTVVSSSDEWMDDSHSDSHSVQQIYASFAYLHEKILASDGVLRIFSYPSMDFSSLGGGFCPSARKARNSIVLYWWVNRELLGVSATRRPNAYGLIRRGCSHHPQRAAHRAGSRRHAR